MPKNKKVSSDSSDSDSGPEDRNPPKKAKTGGGSGSAVAKGPAPKTNEEGCPYWEFGRNRRVTVRDFKGTTYVDIREYYEKDGKSLPGKKGISLKAGEWSLLKDLMEGVDSVLSSR